MFSHRGWQQWTLIENVGENMLLSLHRREEGVRDALAKLSILWHNPLSNTGHVLSAKYKESEKPLGEKGDLVFQ